MAPRSPVWGPDGGGQCRATYLAADGNEYLLKVWHEGGMWWFSVGGEALGGAGAQRTLLGAKRAARKMVDRVIREFGEAYG